MVVELGPGTPERTETGTSTGGVRMPPMAMPSASRSIWGFGPDETAKRGAWGGAWPVRTHVTRSARAALAMRFVGPLLIGTPQWMSLAV